MVLIVILIYSLIILIYLLVLTRFYGFFWDIYRQWFEMPFKPLNYGFMSALIFLVLALMGGVFIDHQILIENKWMLLLSNFVITFFITRPVIYIIPGLKNRKFW